MATAHSKNPLLKVYRILGPVIQLETLTEQEVLMLLQRLAVMQHIMVMKRLLRILSLMILFKKLLSQVQVHC